MTQHSASAGIDQAELYALLHTGNPGDVEHYREVCRDAASVLELGSGSGRIALELAALGRRVTGLELDARKIALARERAARELPPEERSRLRFVQGDMRDFDLGERFDRVLLPYNGLYCLGGVRGALHCLEAVARHLEPDGELWLDAYAVDAFHAEAPEGDDPSEGDEPVAEIELAGQRLWAFESTRWDRGEQVLDVTYSLKNAAGELIGEPHVLHHYLLETEVVLLLDEAGFEVTSLRGGFSGEPFDDDAGTLVIGARLLGERSDADDRP